MFETSTDTLKVRIANLEAEVAFWRGRCATYEANHARLEIAAAEVRGRVEQFLVVLQHARPQGTDRLGDQKLKNR